MNQLKKSIILLALLMAGIVQFGQAANEIEFERGTWKEILAKASKENKLIFFDAYTTWCGPCKWMAANSFTKPEVAEYFNSKFINATFDMERGEGEVLAKQFGVTAYPTLLFIDGQGTVVHSAVGALDAEKLLALGKQVLDPSFVSLGTLQKRYDGGERSSAFLHEFLMRIDQDHPSYEAAVAAFKPNMKGEGLLDEKSWLVFQKHFWLPKSEYATYFLENRQKFEAKFDKLQVQDKATSLYINMASYAVREHDEAGYREALVKVRASELPDAETVALNSEMYYFQEKGDWKGYTGSAEKLLNLLSAPKANPYNAVAWTIYEGTDNKKLLKKALTFAEASVAEEAQYENTDTKAMLLFKLGKTKEGIAAAEEALRLAQEAGHPEDYWIETKNALEAAKAK